MKVAWGQILPNKCYMCKVDKESNDRALAHCSKAKFLWQLVISYLV